MTVFDKIHLIKEEINNLEQELVRLTGYQTQIDQLRDEVKTLSKKMSGLGYDQMRPQIDEREKLNSEIWELEWEAKNDEERLESRRHNIKYFRKLDYPNFKEEDYAYEFSVIDYTESLLRVRPVVESLSGVDSRPKWKRLKDWILKDIEGVLTWRDKIVLQDHIEFLAWVDFFKSKKPYWDLSDSDKETIESFLTSLHAVHQFKNQEVKFKSY